MKSQAPIVVGIVALTILAATSASRCVGDGCDAPDRGGEPSSQPSGTGVVVDGQLRLGEWDGATVSEVPMAVEAGRSPEAEDGAIRCRHARPVPVVLVATRVIPNGTEIAVQVPRHCHDPPFEWDSLAVLTRDAHGQSNFTIYHSGDVALLPDVIRGGEMRGLPGPIEFGEASRPGESFAAHGTNSTTYEFRIFRGEEIEFNLAITFWNYARWYADPLNGSAGWLTVAAADMPDTGRQAPLPSAVGALVIVLGTIRAIRSARR